MNANGFDPSSIKTLIISANHLLFLGLQTILSHVTTPVLASGNGKGDEAMQKEQPRLIIVDMASNENVIGLIDKIKKTVPRAKILLLAGMDDMDRTSQASRLDIDGVVLTVQPPKVILAAVTT